MAHTDQLRTMGLKVTGPRLKILNLFEQTERRHLTAEDVYRLLIAEHIDVGLATVYRVLTQFETAGLVKRHYFEGGHSVFELDRGGHHDHIVCISCGRVEEFVDEVIEGRQQAIAEQFGFTIKHHALTIYGICNSLECRKSQGPL